MSFDRDELLRGLTIYDQSVSIVSAFQYLFTEVADLAETVSHFERYPSIQHSDGGRCTPDFTVLFGDGTGIVGEIARIAVHDNSVDKLCRQIGRYASLDQLPGPAGVPERTSQLDVLLVVPFDLGVAAVRRVIKERYDAIDHSYCPSRKPCIVQFTVDSEKYSFQRIPADDNGVILTPDDRLVNIGVWLDNDNIPVKAERFKSIKAQYRFMNDPTDPLYMASHLWTVEFPELMYDNLRVGKDVPIEINTADITQHLRSRYGIGRKSEVDDGMAILGAAQLARRIDASRWRVAWGDIARKDRDDTVTDTLAERASRAPKSGPITRLTTAERRQAAEVVQQELLWPN